MRGGLQGGIFLECSPASFKHGRLKVFCRPQPVIIRQLMAVDKAERHPEFLFLFGEHRPAIVAEAGCAAALGS
jgi:hypothetical protein